MQDTTLFDQHFATPSKDPDSQGFFQQMLQAEITKTPMKNFYSLNLPAPARKVLETVLLNIDMLKIPTSKDEYRQLVESMMADRNLQDKNVALILRSMADQLKYDRALHTIYIKQLGFQQETRIFHSDRILDIQQIETSSQYYNTGYVKLLDFMILFGIAYGLFSSQEVQSFISYHLSQYILQNDESLVQQQFLTCQEEFQSLITPPMSQAIMETARKNETESIVQVLQETQIKKLQFNQEISSQKNQLEECDETLIAKEDLQISGKQHIFVPRTFQQKIKIENETPYQSSSLQTMLQNLQNPKQISSQKIQYQHSNDKTRDKIFIANPFSTGFKPYQEMSLLSANNSVFATPVKPPRIDSENHLYPNNSELRPKPNSAQNLFPAFQMTPAQLSTAPSSLQKDPFTNQRSLFHSNQKPSLFGNVGSKRFGKDTALLQKSVYEKSHNRRQKLDFKSIKHEEEKRFVDDSDDEDLQNEDLASTVSRKKRGLKILSVKVQELVFKKKSTTYKDVANELIKQLRESKSEIEELDVCDSADGSEDDDMSEDSPQKKGKDSCELQQKWEKNVRRRVYDALNVLYAAGVLQKHGKHVSCDSTVLHMTRKLQEGKNPGRSLSSKNCKTQNDLKMFQQVEHLKLFIKDQKQRVEEKRERLSDQFKHFISYKQLIHRNQTQKEYSRETNVIKLPFILVSTRDSPDNEVEISFGDNNKTLNIAMKKQMKCIGDADTLIRLGFYKVTQDWLHAQDQDFLSIFESLNQQQQRDILIE